MKFLVSKMALYNHNKGKMMKTTTVIMKENEKYQILTVITNAKINKCMYFDTINLRNEK
jgi:hypothetical protein